MLLVAPVLSFALYLVALLQLASLYYEFVKRGRLLARDAVSPAIFLAIVVVLGLGGSLGYAHQAPSTLCAVPLLVSIALLHSLAKNLALSRHLGRALREERKLWGLRLYIYRGRYAGIVSCRERVYVHERLLRILTPKELEALLRHEENHLKPTRGLLELLRTLGLAAVLLHSLGGVTLIALAGCALCALIASVARQAVATELVATLSFLAFFYLLVSSASLALTYAMWAWEHCADVYAAESVGVETFARAVVKVYTVGYIGDCVDYVSLGSLPISMHLEKMGDLTRAEVLKLLLLYTLLARGFVDALVKPLPEAHQPLSARIRAVRTSCPYSVG